MIALRNISARSGDFRLRDVSMQVESGQYAMLMGRTGCGKTTLLETLCGLRSVESGTVLIGGADVTRWSPAARGIGYVPQDLALFPGLTVREHLEFALKLRKWNHAQMTSRVDELAEVLGLKELLPRRTQGLSGGESQRVALGRALSFRPVVLLLDEPLSALDEATRGQMQELLLAVREQSRVTTLHVTHDSREALSLADCVFRIDDGTVVPEVRNRERSGK